MSKGFFLHFSHLTIANNNNNNNNNINNDNNIGHFTSN